MDRDHLQPEFDPYSVPMAALRGILIEHNVPFSGTAKKGDLVQLYEERVRPGAARELASRERVRASSRGIEDHREKVTKPTPSKKTAALPPSSAEILSSLTTGRGTGRTRKSGNMSSLTAEPAVHKDSRPTPAKKGQSPSTFSGRPPTSRSASIELLDINVAEEVANDADMEVTLGAGSRRLSKAAKPRRPLVAPSINSTVTPSAGPGYAQESTNASLRASVSLSPTKPVVEVVMKRKLSQASPETSTKRKASDGHIPEDMSEVPAEKGFSDYNPFQSGGEESPDGEKKQKRRKSSLGVYTDRNAPTSSTSIRRSATMQSFSNDAAKPVSSLQDREDRSTPSFLRRHSSRSHRDSQVPPVPSIPNSVSSRASGLTSSKSLSNLGKYSAPLESLQMRPEDFSLSIGKKAEHVRTPADKGRGQPNKNRISDSSRFTPQLTAEDEEILVELASEAILDENEESVAVGPSIASPGKPRKSRSPKKSPKRGPIPHKNHETMSDQAGNKRVLASSQKALGHRGRTFPRGIQFAGLALPLITLLWSYGGYWASQKRELGFCDTDATSNRATVHRRMRTLTSPKAFTNSPTVDGFLQDAIVALTPQRCESCPTYAICADGQVKTCVKDYLLQPKALAFLFSDGSDPKKSILPLLFKPSCRPDTERLIRVAETATQIAGYLKDHKGQIICSGEEKARQKVAKRNSEGAFEDWAVYGASEDWVRKVMSESKDPKISDAAFDGVFDEAIEDLSSHDEILRGKDEGGEPWVAAVAATLPLSCRTRLAAYNAADEHKTAIASLFGAILLAIYGRYKIALKRRTREQVDDLVPIALKLLQQQEQDHHIDNVLTPYPYLAPSQLRDLVLAHEHSPSRRAELWKRVEQVVEGNSNVRAKIEEQYGEDLRVWQWVGGAYGYIEDDFIDKEDEGNDDAIRKRRRYGSLASRPSLSRPGTPRNNTPGRHITWSKDVKKTFSPQ